MCGINLIINPDTDAGPIQKMMQAISHRGPDHSSWSQIAAGIFVAGNRLKILDMGNLPNQPIFTPDGMGVLVWNGALYNYQDLRNILLDEGVSFQTRSDSEVLIHWLKIFGAAGVDRLEGMFSFIFIDKEKKHIIISRDRTGKKPLYYSHQGNRWLFSSETSGIIASGLVTPALDSSQLVPYFYSRHTFPDSTFYKHVSQFPTGRVRLIDFRGKLLEEKPLAQIQKDIALPSAADFKELLIDAVLKHFHAEVPVGITLSGGADSSLLLNTWYKETGTPLHTYTATFGKKYSSRYPDGGFAAQLATKFRCDHHEVEVNPTMVLENWEDYISSLDQPVGDSAGFLTWMIAKEAKKNVKVLISGAGADELFGGYNRHTAFRKYLKNPSLYGTLGKRIGNLSFLPRLIRKFIQAVDIDPVTTYLNFSSLQPPPAAERGRFTPHYSQSGDHYKDALEWDRSYYLVNDILKIHDNASMAHGLEGRAPYLDSPIVQLSANLSEEQHLSLAPKQWIKILLQEGGLAHIAKRKKAGFGIPLKAWLQEDIFFRERVIADIKLFEKSHGHIFPEEMGLLAKDPKRYIGSSFLQLWNLFVLASWVKFHKL